MSVACLLQEWVWISDCKIDKTINAKDPDGWGYALGFEAGANAFSLGEWMVGDGVRRRRWYRTRQRTDAAAAAMQEKQRRVTASSKKLQSGLPEPEIQGWLFKVRDALGRRCKAADPARCCTPHAVPSAEARHTLRGGAVGGRTLPRPCSAQPRGDHRG